MSSIDIIGPGGKRLPAGSKAPKGARYRARWRTPDGRSRTKTFDRKLDAERHLAGVTVSKAEGAYIDPSAGRATFGTYATAWAAAQPHRESTAAGVEQMLRLHILPTFGHRPLGSIRTGDVQAWVTGLELAPSTVGVVYGKLVAIMNAAVEDRLIVRSPCTRRVRLPRSDGAEVVPMTAEQVRAIADHVAGRYRAYVVLLAGTGLRPAEGLGLSVDRVDFLRRTIRVDRQLLTLKGRPPVLAPVKTTSSVRTIPVPQGVLDVLARHLDEYPTADTDRLIFTNANGRRIRRADLSHLWRAGAAKAGVTGFSPHDLRHFAASVMIDQGTNVKAVQRHLGHASAKVTLDTYSHLWPDSEDVTRRALSAGIERIVSAPCHPADDAASS